MRTWVMDDVSWWDVVKDGPNFEERMGFDRSNYMLYDLPEDIVDKFLSAKKNWEEANNRYRDARLAMIKVMTKPLRR